MATQNLVLQANHPNTTWTNVNITAVEANAVAPDGTTTASTVSDDVTNATHRLEQTQSLLTTGKRYCYTWRVKKVSGAGWVMISGNGGSSLVSASFDLTNGGRGTTGANCRATITPLGSGWYECSVTYLADASFPTIVDLYMCSADNTTVYAGGSNSIAIWHGQLEQSNATGEYADTTTAVVDTGAPAFRRLPENLALQSEDMSSASWTKPASSTATANTSDVTDPLGGNTASKIVYDGSGAVNSNRISNVPSGTGLSSTQQYVGSVWMRVSAGTVATSDAEFFHVLQSIRQCCLDQSSRSDSN